MKKIIVNQQGYALVLVLLTITVIGILTPPLFNSVLNSANQYQKSEESVQKQKLVEMGKRYARYSIANEVGSLPTSSVEDARDELQNRLSNSTVSLDSSQNNQAFSIDYSSFKKDGNQLEVTYMVTGRVTTNTQEISELHDSETCVLELSGGGGPLIDWGDLTEEDFSDEEKFPNQLDSNQETNFKKAKDKISGNTNFEEQIKIKKDGEITVNGGAVIQDGILMSKGGALKVTGHLYAIGEKITINNGSTFIVGKNAWFKDVEIQIQRGGTLCVRGEIKEWNVSGQGANKPADPVQVSSCDQASDGIFYVGQYFDNTEGSGGRGWSIIEAS